MWEVCSGPSVNANVSPPISKYMNDDSNGFESSQHRDGQQILKPFSTDNEYKSEIFLQSVLDLHKTNKLNRNEDENTRIWSSGGRTSDQNGSRNLFSPKSASEDHNRFQTQLHPNNQINAGHDDVANIHDGIGRDGKASEDQSTGVTSSNGATVANKTFRTIRCYHCRMCDQEFVNKSDMQRHAKEVHRLEDKGYKCVKCLKTFPSSQQLAQHALVHTNVRKYPCRFCDKSFKQLSHVQQHLRIHTGERPYQCTVEGCSKAFRQLSSLQQHIKGHNIPLPKSYPILHPIPTSDPAESKDKIRTNLARPTDLICQVCEKHCTDEIRYFQHIHKYHPDFWRVFSGGRPLSDYIEDESRPNSKQYRCNICEKSCSSESSYWKHLSLHPGATTNPGAMHQGVMNRVGGNVGSAEDDQLQIYTCKVCQKLFTKEAHLVRHMEMRLDEHHSAGLLELKKSRPAFRDSKDGSVRTPHSPEQDMESEAEHKKESSDMSFAKHPTSSVYNQPHRSMSLDTKMYHDHDQLADRASLPEAGLNGSRYGVAVQSSISSGSRSPSPPPAFSTFPYRDEPPHADRFLETAMHSPSAQLTNHSRFSRSVSTSDVDVSRRFYDAYSDRSSPMSHLQRLSPTNHASSVSKAVDPATHFNQCFRSPLPSESPLHLSIPPPRSVICPSFMPSSAYYNLSQNQSAFLKRKMTPDEEDQLLYRRHMDTSTDYSLNRDGLKSEIDAYHYDIGTRNVDSFYRRHFDVPEDSLNRRLGGGISDEKYVVSAFNHPSSVRSFSGFR